MEVPSGFVIGIDGGGTHTRVLVSDLAGHALAYAEGGAASFHKDADARSNVHNAVLGAVAKAGSKPEDARGIALGVAGYDAPSDAEWVEPLTDIPGFVCPRWHVNDAVIAHYGALMARPGIIAISGTGSIIAAITEQGTYLRNYDFRHYAASAARFLVYDAVFELLGGGADASDDGLVAALLAHFKVASLAELRTLASEGFHPDRRERDRHFGLFAPTLTEAAAAGSALAQRVCERAVLQVRTGIEMMAGAFADDTVEVAFIGSVVAGGFFRQRLAGHLAQGRVKRYRVVEPRLSPAEGAVMLALSRLGADTGEPVAQRLRGSAERLAAVQPS